MTFLNIMDVLPTPWDGILSAHYRPCLLEEYGVDEKSYMHCVLAKNSCDYSIVAPMAIVLSGV